MKQREDKKQNNIRDLKIYPKIRKSTGELLGVNVSRNKSIFSLLILCCT